MNGSAEWNACQNPRAMLECLRRWPERRVVGHDIGHNCRWSDRLLRLFTCACVRHAWRLLTDPRSRAAVAVAERYADGEATAEEMNDAGTLVLNVYQSFPQDSPAWAANLMVERLTHHCTAERHASAMVASTDNPFPQRAGLVPATQTALLRDIIGNPFAPVSIRGPCPNCRGEPCVCQRHWEREPLTRIVPWLTAQVVSLAHAAYTDRREDGTLDPFRLAILADALEEAGCDYREPDTEAEEYRTCQGCGGHGTNLSTGRYPEDCQPCWGCGGAGGVTVKVKKQGKAVTHPLIAHLRSPGPHVRGCHAIDLLTGRS